jgi:hypothetical protein
MILVNLINPFDAVSYLFNEKIDCTPKLSVDVSRTAISSRDSSISNQSIPKCFLKPFVDVACEKDCCKRSEVDKVSSVISF